MLDGSCLFRRHFRKSFSTATLATHSQVVISILLVYINIYDSEWVLFYTNETGENLVFNTMILKRAS